MPETEKTIQSDEKSPALGRGHVKYIAIPIPLYEQLQRLADREDRSISWEARVAIGEFLSRKERQE